MGRELTFDRLGALALANLGSLGAMLAAIAAAAVTLHCIERASGRFVAHRLGWRGVLATGWIGVPVHELSHLLVAKLFGHRIVGWALFDPDPASGTLGYVRHAPSRMSVLQRAGNLAVALAPIAGGSLAIALVAEWALHGGLASARASGCVPVSDAAALFGCASEQSLRLASGLWQGRSWLLPLQLYVCAAIASHMAPSLPDFACGARGLVWCGIVVGVAAVALAIAGRELAFPPTLVIVLALVVGLAAVLQLLWVAVVAAVATVRG